MSSVVTPLAGQLPSTAPPALEPVPPVILEEVDSLELIDLFQRAWRPPLFRIVQQLSQGILQGSLEDEERCTLVFLILPGLVAE